MPYLPMEAHRQGIIFHTRVVISIQIFRWLYQTLMVPSPSPTFWVTSCLWSEGTGHSRELPSFSQRLGPMATTLCTSLLGKKAYGWSPGLLNRTKIIPSQGDRPGQHDQRVFGVCETRRGLPSRWTSLPQPGFSDPRFEARGGSLGLAFCL